ncbi:cyclin-dependent protein kinase inhibitor SMR6 [Lactuca sativa]|uniref:cyclin-dependent protein kinase inhibitor SMR6 n=1 Tax=Lactuca sativa TaxID=4236 RepID=UPI001C68E1C5|nr:cyclin-dependent protein kinase inhibitor SMR6 [Lactuca sativa]
MGFSKKHQVDGDIMEGKTWVISGITMCAPLRCVSTNKANGETDEGSNSGSTTPTLKESRLPEKFRCPPPPAPKKRRPVSKCQKNGDIQFFTSPELDSFFENFANAERAKYKSHYVYMSINKVGISYEIDYLC